MNTWLLTLSNEEISLGIDAVYDSAIRKQLEDENSELQAFMYDQDLLAEAEWLAKWDFDRTAAQLTWRAPND